MKTLKQLREEYDANALPQVAPEDLVFEEKDGIRKLQDVPNVSMMPNLLMFRRVTYRKYPGNQTVALYYSKMVDKYLSIPFGPTGNLNLSEATVYDTMEELDICEGAKWEAIKGGIKGAVKGGTAGFIVGTSGHVPGAMIGTAVGAGVGAYKGAKKAYQKAKDSGIDEDWQSVNRHDKTDGLSQKAVNAYRRENPGSKLKTAVTEKNPSGKRAARRKSFCSRMGGMKKRLTSAKTARDPDSRINKALRRWNCEESFRQKINEKREERLDEFLPLVVGAGEALAGMAARGAIGAGIRAVGSQIARKGVRDAAINLGKKALSKVSKVKPRKAPPTPKKPSTSGKLDALSAATDIAKNATDSTSAPSTGDSGATRTYSFGDVKKAQVKTHSPEMHHTGDSAIDASRRSAIIKREYEASGKKPVAENKITDLRAMLDEGVKLHDININGRTVTLNSSMAKRIVEVYDSVNTKNKKIVEGMLNDDLESFKKLLNFSIKN